MKFNEQQDQRFSIDKTSLILGEFEQLINYEDVKSQVLANRGKVLESALAREGKGVFRFPNFQKYFSLDGSVVMREGAETIEFIEFFKREGRKSIKQASDEVSENVAGTEHYLRGARYLASIDPSLETAQRLSILLEDFMEGVSYLVSHSLGVSSEESIFKQELAVLDYVKNATIVVLNALVQNEKMGLYRIDDVKYQEVRKGVIYMARQAVFMYYSYMIGSDTDFTESRDVLCKRFQRFTKAILFLEQEYREGAINNHSFSRPEANHPLVIGASALLNAENKGINPSTIFAFPSGGTELAFAEQYAMKKVKGYTPQVVLFPFSLYSVSQMPKSVTEGKKVSTQSEYLEKFRASIDGREIIILDDNSNTGNTIQRFYNLILQGFVPKNVTAAIAEADVIRAVRLKNSKFRSTVVSPLLLATAVNILPVGKKKLQSELKEDIERKRLLKECRSKLESASTPSEKMMYAIFLRNLLEPTVSVLKRLTPENSIQKFSGSFLSNYYVAPVSYDGVDYTSTEKAYQAAKFKLSDLKNIPEAEMSYIQERMNCMGMYIKGENLENFFTDPHTSSGASKSVANILRKQGFQRPDWEELKMQVMIEVLQSKFENPEMMRRLKSTGDKYLVEGNDWGDVFWGIDAGKGRNILGLALMYIRDGENFLDI